jgi:hypothetical protein
MSLRVEVASTLSMLRGGVQVDAVQVVRLASISHGIIAAAYKVYFEVIFVDSLLPAITAIRISLKQRNLRWLDKLGIIEVRRALEFVGTARGLDVYPIFATQRIIT